ncbi:MAG: molybdopterin-guanine dinucleotide biosynthesis protein B [Smithella sp.]|nr:molybdopterin-guanine dinucleotide biosynthesis protein B [Smithella sp.]
MTIPLISIVGKSNSGKTTLVEKLIPELVKRGYRVATIKHNKHGFDIDHEGKDSWRHKKAGACATVIACPTQVALIEDLERDLSLDEIRDNYIKNADVILAEGFKGNPFPKIEVHRAELQRELLCGKEDNLLAIASDSKPEIGVPCLDINDVKGIADLIVKNLLK